VSARGSSGAIPERADTGVGPYKKIMRKFPPKLILLIAVLAVATSGPLTKHASLPALTIVAWRLACVTPLLLVQARWVDHGPLWPAARRSMGALLLTSLVLALHFFSFALAIKLTAISTATMLLALEPVVTMALARRITGEAPARRALAGLALAFPGALLIAGEGGLAGFKAHALGNGFALLSGLSGAIHLMLVRRLRGAVPFGTLTAATYGGAAAVLLIAAAGFGNLSLPAASWGVMALLVIIPTGIGHNLVNLSLRFLPAPAVNLALLLEPVIATALAMIFFAERPALFFWIGAALILAGCLAALWPERGAPAGAVDVGTEGPAIV
jgi:drug/metabolite transporter (DMT)-like permease